MESATPRAPAGDLLLAAPFFGRARELAALRAAIDGARCRVTVTGPPGAGKARLVREALRASGRAWREVDAAKLGVDAAAWARAVSGAAGLVILRADLLSSAAAAAARAAADADVAWIATAAGRLGVDGERVLRLGGLGPGDGDGDGGEDPAVALLCAAAGGVGAVAAKDPAALVRIAERVGRNPRALVVAGRRLGSVPAARLADGLDHPADVTDPELARGVERALGGLSESARAMVEALSVVAGPASAARVAAVAGRALSEVEGGLAGLAARGLVAVTAPSVGARRFALEPNVRAVVGREVASAPARLAALADRYARHVEAGRGAVDHAGVVDDILALGEAAAGAPAAATAQRAAAVAAFLGAHRLIRRRRPLGRSVEILRALVCATPGLEARGRVRAEALLGELLYLVGRGEEARARLEAALADPAHAADPAGRAAAEAALGASWAYGRADIPVARLSEAVSALEDDGAGSGDEARLRVARALEHAGDAEAALAAYDAIAPETPRARALTALNRASLVIDLGRGEEAIAPTREALAWGRAVGDALVAAVASANLGIAHMDAGRLDVARGAFEDALAEAGPLGFARGEALARLHLAALAVAAGRLEEASAQAGLASARWRSGWPDPFGEALLGLTRAVVAARAGDRGRVAAAVDAGVLALEGCAGPGAVALRAILGQVADGAWSPEEVSSVVSEGLAAVAGRPRVGAHAVRAAAVVLGVEAAGHLWVARDGTAFRVAGGDAVSLGRRGPARRILATLAAEAAAGPPRPMDALALYAVGWPGQPLGEDYQRSRVHGVMAELRRLGLGALLAHTDAGYALAGRVWLGPARVRNP